MKLTRPFHFFFIPLWVCCCLGFSLLYGQEPTDSLSHHYQAIISPHSPDDLPLGIAFYSQQKQQQLQARDTLGAIASLRMIAIGQFKIGNPYDSENSIVEALGLVAGLKDKDTLTEVRVGLLNQLGRIYRTLENTPEALRVLDEALSIARKTSDSITLINNKANLFKDAGNYEEALALYARLHPKSLKGQDSLQQAMVLDNMGAVLAELGAAGARDTLVKALDIRRRHLDLSGQYASYKNLALYHARLSELPLAQSYARLALETTQTLNSASFEYDALELLMQLHPDPEVLAFLQQTDSLSRARQLAENKNAFIKYNLNEERKKTVLQELEKEKQKRSKQLFQLSTVSILLLLLLSYFVFRYRYKKGRQEEMYKTESRISKKVHDELANEVFNVLAFAESKTIAPPGDKEKLLSSLDHIYTKTRDISKDMAWIPTGADYARNLKELLAGFSAAGVHVITNGIDTIPWAQLAEVKKMACYRVLQELMVNMKKHSGASLVLIKFLKEKGRVTITYSDNGNGIAKEALLNRGGLLIAENRIAAIKGSFTFNPTRNQGFKCSFSIPL